MANVIVKNGIVAYQVTSDMKLTDTGLITRGFIDPTTTTENAKVVENVFIPNRFQPGMFSYDEETRLIKPLDASLPYLLEQYKAEKLSELNAACDEALAALTASYPAMETLTFDKQETEARAFNADDPESGKFVRTLAAARGIDASALAAKIIVKSDVFAQASGYLIGLRQKYEDQLDAAQTIGDIEAIVFDFSFPSTEEPDTPEIPTDPEQPTEPEQPVDPVQPSEPEQPVE